MQTTLTPEVEEIMNHRFGKDNLIALATLQGETPWVRAVNSYYEKGAFYVITHALSNKMQQLAVNPRCSICGDWFTAHGVGKNMGHILAEENKDLADRLRAAFSDWYENGHADENDPNTCILCIELTDGVLFNHGTRYDIHFA